MSLDAYLPCRKVPNAVTSVDRPTRLRLVWSRCRSVDQCACEVPSHVQWANEYPEGLKVHDAYATRRRRWRNGEPKPDVQASPEPETPCNYDGPLKYIDDILYIMVEGTWYETAGVAAAFDHHRDVEVREGTWRYLHFAGYMWCASHEACLAPGDEKARLGTGWVFEAFDQPPSGYLCAPCAGDLFGVTAPQTNA